MEPPCISRSSDANVLSHIVFSICFMSADDFCGRFVRFCDFNPSFVSYFQSNFVVCVSRVN